MTQPQDYIVSFNFSPALTEFSFFQLNNEASFVQENASREGFKEMGMSVFWIAIEKLKDHCLSGSKYGVFLDGPFLQYSDKYAPDLLSELRQLAETKQIELLGGSYYNSTIVSPKFFTASVQKQKSMIKSLLGIEVVSFCAPCGMYSDECGTIVESLGFRNYVFEPPLWLGKQSDFPEIFSNPDHKHLQLLPLGLSGLTSLSAGDFIKLSSTKGSNQLVSEISEGTSAKSFGSKYILYSEQVVQLQYSTRYKSIMKQVKRLATHSNSFDLLGLTTDLDEIQKVVSPAETDGFIAFMNRLSEIELSVG